MFVFKDFTRNVRIHHSDVENDNIVFRLHYRVTFWFLMACCVLVSSKQFIKDHINCITDKYLEHVVDTFCFFKSTFTVASLHNSSMVVNHYAAHPGVGMYTGKEEIVRHGYYQWVPFILFLQALSFYFPRKLWKITDDGRLSKIVQHMRTARLVDSTDRVINNVKIESEESRTKKTRWFSSTYLTISRFRVTRDWARMLVLCEFLNALNLIANWYLTDTFFNGKFSALGSNWWNDRTDYVEEIFPKVTKCTFHKYGSSGSIQNHDTICIMSLNIINEKIYVLLWFWFIVLFIMTAAGLVWRLLTLLLHNRSYAFNKLIWGEVSPGPALNPLDIEILTRRLCFADWMFLYYIGKNIDGKIFRTAVSQVAVELSKYKPNRLLTLENSVDEDPKESDC